MQNQVIAHIEIEDQKIEYYSSVLIRQQFNAHHEFVIRIKYDVVEKEGVFKLKNAQKLIGKSAIIKLLQADGEDAVYEFRGLICEITMEQSENFTSDLLLKGYSPTILLENGPHLASFYQSDLKKIVKQVTKALSQNNCSVNLKPQYAKQITYICQYKESGFHFLNRLSAHYSEWFYYDGKQLNFGKPSSSKNINITYGEDLNNVQFTLRLMPMTFSNFSYVSKNDSVINSNAPSGVDGLDQYASYALKESNKIFSEPVNMPLRQRIESKTELDGFVKKQKEALAADLEVLTGSSDNPAVCIGAVANIRIASPEDDGSAKEEYGKFLITSIQHHVAGNGKYYNTFEAIPSTLETIPVRNISEPIAEPQIAIVTDNKDPNNTGRIKVQMLWQKAANQTTDWIRVMTSDAGNSDKVSKNRGFVFIPEVGDQVLVCFRYNDADRPFVLGSIFHGKTGGGNKDGNNVKTLSTKSGNTITLDDTKNAEKVTVNTPSGHTIDINDKKGAENITIIDKNKNKIVIDSVGDSINITANDSINLNAPSINLNATTISSMAKGAILMNAGAAIEAAAGTMVTFGAGVSTSLISAMDTTILAGKMLSASGGKNVKLGSGAGAKIELQSKGEATFNSSKKMDISSKESTMTGTDKATFKSKEAVLEGSSKAVVKGSQIDIS